MRPTSPSLATRLTAMMLIVAVSLCCCHAHFLTGGLSDHDDALASSETASCCPGCAEVAPDEAPAPAKRCRTCCIKGTGLDYQPIVLPVLVSLPFPAPMGAEDQAASPVTPAPRLERTVRFPEPPTLLRLHCALVV